MSSEKVVVGIDVGTAFSSIGVWDTKLGRARLIADEYGRTRISSAVAFLETHRVIGSGATDEVTENCIFGTKRLMGRKLCDQPSIVEGWPFNIEGNDFASVSVRYKNHRKIYSCQEIMAMTISKLKHLAEYDLGCPVTDAVIGVPAYFTNIQRQSVLDACIIAGLSVKQIVNEASAAAIHYAVEEQVCGSKRVLVLDFGAGSVDVSVCMLEKGLCEIIASAGDTSLGGLDFDKLLVDYCVEDMKVKRKKDITQNKKTMIKLRRSCERAKIELSSQDSTSIDLEFNDADFKIVLYRTIFEEMCTAMIKKCMGLVTRCLEAEGLRSTDIDAVVLLGGCNKIPAVQQRLKSCLDGKDILELKSDEFVAVGATYLAASLSGLVNGLVLRDIANLSLSCEYRLSGLSPLSLKSKVKSKKKVVIAKHSPIPTKTFQVKIPIEKSFLTSNDRKIVLKIYEGDNNLVGEAESEDVESSYKLLGKFELNTKGSDLVTIRLKADTNGIINLSAQGNEGNCIPIVGDTGRLSKVEISKLTSEAAKCKLEDEEIWKQNRSNLGMNVIQGTDTETLEDVCDTLEEVPDTLKKVSDTFKDILGSDTLKKIGNDLKQMMLFLRGLSTGGILCFAVVIIIIIVSIIYKLIGRSEDKDSHPSFQSE